MVVRKILALEIIVRFYVGKQIIWVIGNDGELRLTVNQVLLLKLFESVITHIATLAQLAE